MVMMMMMIMKPHVSKFVTGYLVQKIKFSKDNQQKLNEVAKNAVEHLASAKTQSHSFICR